MARFLKKGLLVLAVFGIVWLAIIIWWQESRTLPTGVDIALYLFALPLALLGTLWLGMKLVRAARAPKPEADTDAGDEPAPETVAAAHGPARLDIVAVAAQAWAGPDSATLLKAVIEQKRPELDPGLKSESGYPVFAARAPHLDDDELGAIARERGLDDSVRAPGLLRALRLLADTARPLVSEAHRHVTALDVPAREADWPALTFMVLVPDDWSDAARDHARAEVVAAAGVWPDTRVSAAVHAVHDAAAADALLREIAALPAPATPVWRIVLAADGYIDATRVAQWDAQSRLLTPANPQGHVPGEAAAGLLIGPDAAQARVRVAFSPIVRRAKPADARGALAESAFVDSVETLLKTEALDPGTLGGILSDADHRGSRPLEPVDLTARMFPHLDPAKDCAALGVACGHTGAASTLLTLALASEACTQFAHPVLALSLQDPALRCAALVTQPAAASVTA